MHSAALDRTGTRALVSLCDKLNKYLAMPTAPARSVRDRSAPKSAPPKPAAPKQTAPRSAAPGAAAPAPPAPLSGADPIGEFFAGLAAPGHIATFAGESATLRFDVTNGSKLQHWYVTINNGNVAVTRDNSAADVVVRIERPYLEDIVTGQLNAQAAMLRQVLTVEGDMAALMMFQRCLPGPGGSTGRVAPISSQTVMAQRRPM
jgi:SCP-2 sterol transfer family protein